MDKTKKIYTILASISLISLIIGAAYAYFNVTFIVGSTSVDVEGDVEEVGTVTLIGVEDEGEITLTAEDTSMMNSGEDYTYPTSGSPLTIATISASGNASDNITYYCKVALTITNSVTSGTLNEGDVSINYGGELATRLNQNSISLLDEGYLTTTEGVASGSINETITDTFSIKSGDTYTLTKLVTIHNTLSDQQNLKGLSFTAKTEITNLTCDTSNMGSSIFNPLELLTVKKGTDGLANHVSGGMYRYQGNGQVCSYNNGNYKVLTTSNTCSNLYSYGTTTYASSCPSGTECTTYTGTVISEEVNNYLCIGASTCSTDKNTEDSHTFRILGITPDGNMKVISMFNDGNKQWAPSNDLNYDWSNSPLQLYLNSSDDNGYLKKLGSISSSIELWDWYYTKTFDTEGDVKTLRSSVNYIGNTGNATSQYANDTNTSKLTVLNTKVGLMNISDFYYANCDTCGFSKTVWINSANNQDSGYTEWMSSRSSSNYACGVHTNNISLSVGLTNTRPVRPVFYLSSDVYLKGTGGKNDPYVLLS